LSTSYGEARARLASENYATLCVPGFAQFLTLFVLFHKTIVKTHKTVDNKAPEQILPYSDNTLFRNKEQFRVTRELLNQTALKTVLWIKQINITHAVLESCTGRFVISAPWESTLGLHNVVCSSTHWLALAKDLYSNYSARWTPKGQM